VNLFYLNEGVSAEILEFPRSAKKLPPLVDATSEDFYNYRAQMFHPLELSDSCITRVYKRFFFSFLSTFSFFSYIVIFRIQYKVEKGTCLSFPSYVIHRGVPPNGTEERRALFWLSFEKDYPSWLPKPETNRQYHPYSHAEMQYGLESPQMLSKFLEV
jgi:hypothetical protein